MNFGVQLFSYKPQLKTPEGVEKVFAKMQKMGVKTVQLSGLCKMPAEEIKRLTEKYELKIACTHNPFDRIVNDTENLIAEHKVYGCDTIGLGMMPKKYRDNNYAKIDEFVALMKTACDKITEAGLNFAYHNHKLEFDKINGKTIFDILMDEIPNLKFIFDTFWCRAANEDLEKWINKLAGRLDNVHLKDYRKLMGVIPFFADIGYGQLDFVKIVEWFEKVGAKNALVEKDFSINIDKSIGRSWKYLQKTFNA